MVVREFMGFLFVRKSGEGKGIIMSALDIPDSSKLEPEKMHVFRGVENDDGTITLVTTGEILDPLHNVVGYRADQVLTAPIWKSQTRDIS